MVRVGVGQNPAELVLDFARVFRASDLSIELREVGLDSQPVNAERSVRQLQKPLCRSLFQNLQRLLRFPAPFKRKRHSEIL